MEVFYPQFMRTTEKKRSRKVMGKAWWHSKTIWTAISQAVIGGVFTIKEAVEAGEASSMGIALIIVAVVQTILRLVTNQPVTKPE